MEMDDESSEDDLAEGELEEQMTEDEYEDRQAENTAPATEDPKITIRQYVCLRCGKKVREPARFIAPVHCGTPMREVKEFGHATPFPQAVCEKKMAAKKTGAAKPKKKARKAAKKPAKKKARSRR